MAQPVRVDRCAGVQALTSAVVRESPTSLLHDDRRCGVVPDVAGEPDAHINYALGDHVLVAPGTVDRPPARESLDDLLALREEAVECRKADEPVRAGVAPSRDADASCGRTIAGASKCASTTLSPPSTLLQGAGADTEDNRSLDFEREQRSPGLVTRRKEPSSVNAVGDPPPTGRANVLSHLLTKEPILGAGFAERAEHRRLCCDVRLGDGRAVVLLCRGHAAFTPPAQGLRISHVHQPKRQLKIRLHRPEHPRPQDTIER